MKKPAIILLSSLVFLATFIALTLSVYALTNSTATGPTPTVTVSLELNGLISGAIAGAVYGALGYYSDLKTVPGEKFDNKQFLITVGVGAVVGLFIPITAPTDISGLLLSVITAFSSFGGIYFIQKGATIVHALTGKQVIVQKPPA